MGWKDSYEGFLEPKAGDAPYRIIDDPALIAKKNKMREALRDEYTKRMYNPYRMAAGIGGGPFDPAVVRYNSMMRTQTQFFRPGPKLVIFSFFSVVVPGFLIYYIGESHRAKLMYLCRTGQIAYKDREGRMIR